MKQTDNIPAGYKRSPLGIIPKEWEVKEFCEVASLCKGKYVPSINEHKKCIELENIAQEDGSIIGWIDSAKQKSTKTIFEIKNVLFGKLRPYLRKYWHANFEGVCSSEIWVLKEKQVCSSDFLFRLIQSDKFIQAANVSSGSKMPRADWNYVSSFPFALPPLPEQQKIAEILSVWDSAIEMQSALIEKLETRKHGLMQQLLTGKKRLKGFSREWKKVKLGNVFTEVTTPNDGMHDYPVMTISSKQGLVSQQNKFDRVIAGNSLSKYILLQKDDFAYNKGNSKTYPMGCIFKLVTHDNVLVPFVYICFRKAIQISSEFYEQWFSNHGLDRQLKRIITSGARGDGLLNVDSMDFFRLIIPLPKIEEQIAIAEILTTADNEIALAKQKLESLRQQKKGLMQVLLTGKKRVKIRITSVPDKSKE